MNKITMAELSGLAGTPEQDIHNWLKRLDLATDYGKTKTGPARVGRFTRQNALEISLIARLVETGMTPSAAAARVHRLFAQLQDKQPGGYVLIVGDNVICSDRPPSAALLRALDVAGVVVNLGKLSDEIDDFFDTARDENG